VECWATFQRTNQENIRLSFAMLNFLHGEIASFWGIPELGPQIRIPVPIHVQNAPVTMNTTNRIHVESGSQVGQINAGAIVYLNRAVGTFDGAGQSELASALQAFTQQVVDSQELSIASQRQILDLLRSIIGEVSKPKQERNFSITKLALEAIGTLVTVSTTIGQHWEKLKHLLDQFMR
jgi:hypothetical protein